MDDGDGFLEGRGVVGDRSLFDEALEAGSSESRWRKAAIFPDIRAADWLDGSPGGCRGGEEEPLNGRKCWRDR